MTNERRIKHGEPHPSAISANEFLSNLSGMDILRWKDTFMRHADEGSRQAEVCFDTLERMEQGLPVADVEILGLAWAITHEPA